MNLTRHRRRLETLRADLLLQLGNAEGLQKHGSLRDSVGELSVVDNHPADMGSENFERAKNLSLHEKNLLTLKKVEEALDRLEAGRYGVCERCGRNIPDERLEAVPYTALCMNCREKEENATRFGH